MFCKNDSENQFHDVKKRNDDDDDDNNDDNSNNNNNNNFCIIPTFWL